jgi:hypothetical protein
MREQLTSGIVQTAESIREAVVIESYERLKARVSNVSCIVGELNNRLSSVMRDTVPTACIDVAKEPAKGSALAQDLRAESDILDSVIENIQDILDRLDV